MRDVPDDRRPVPAEDPLGSGDRGLREGVGYHFDTSDYVDAVAHPAVDRPVSSRLGGAKAQDVSGPR